MGFGDLSTRNKGWPAKEITHYADEQAIELLVMGTMGRMGVPGFFIGNTAEDVLDAVRCVVLIVKQSGSSTPAKI
ncbi:MAG: universal stress protein [Gammaproteobacteria bacterium]